MELDTDFQTVVTDSNRTIRRLRVPNGWLVDVLDSVRNTSSVIHYEDAGWLWTPDNDGTTFTLIIDTTARDVMRLRVRGGWIVDVTDNVNNKSESIFVKDPGTIWAV